MQEIIMDSITIQAMLSYLVEVYARTYVETAANFPSF